MRRVVIVAFADLQPLDVTGPAEVFSIAAQLREDEYAVEVVAPNAEPLATWSGYAILPAGDLAGCEGPIDTLIVAGGEGARRASRDDQFVTWIRAAAARSRRVCSVCTGAFLLAEAGLLDGRRATTHWAWCDELARRHPTVEVERDPIFVVDGPVRTSAGVTAGMDLALALVEEDLGPRAALQVARWLVLFVRRPGGQAQFSAALAGPAATRDSLRELQAWMLDHLDADLSVPALASRASMSPRNFARAFRRETGMTPAVYVEALRLERARLALETTALSVDDVARRCGFGTVETMRRVFARRLSVSPADYRRRFAA